MKKIIAGGMVVFVLAGCASSKDTYVPPSSTPSGSVSESAPPAAPVPRKELLAVTDLPTGWTVDNKPSDATASLPPCDTVAVSTKRAKSAATATFALGTASPFFIETIGYFPGASAKSKYAYAVKHLDACKQLSYKVKKVAIKGTLSVTSFPATATESRAYTANLLVGSSSFTLYVVVARSGHQVADLTYGILGTGNIFAFQRIVSAATAKLTRS